MSYADRYRSIVDELSGKKNDPQTHSHQTQHRHRDSSRSRKPKDTSSSSRSNSNVTLSSLRKQISDKDLQLVELRAQRWELADALRLVRSELTQAFEQRQRELRQRDSDIQRLEQRLEKQKSRYAELQQAFDGAAHNHARVQHLEERLRLMNQDLLESQEQSARDMVNASNQIHQLQHTITEYEQQLSDSSLALQQKSELEDRFRAILQEKDNELQMIAQRSRQRVHNTEQHAAAIASETQTLRAALVSEQKKRAAIEQNLEAVESQLLSEQSTNADLQRRIGVLEAEQEANDMRSRSLEDSTEASLLYERDALQSRVESLQNQFEKLKVELEVKDSQLKSFDEADDAAAMASSVMADELATVQEMLKAKENVLSEIDEEMRRLHNEKLELQQKCQSQDHLINNLYRRLEDKEVCTESGEPEPVREYIQPDVKKLDGKVEPVFDDILPLCERLRQDSVALSNLIISHIEGTDPDVRYLVGHSDDKDLSSFDEDFENREMDVVATLRETSESLTKLRNAVSDEYANRIGDSCAMQ